MGNDRVTTQNLKIVKSDTDDNYVLVKGAVPGAKGGTVIVRNAVRLNGLTGLTADSPVYYRVCDQDGCGQRFWFRTAPNDDTPFVAIMGGDTRTGWDTRREQ